jgi:hypothetical protein
VDGRWRKERTEGARQTKKTELDYVYYYYYYRRSNIQVNSKPGTFRALGVKESTKKREWKRKLN